MVLHPNLQIQGAGVFGIWSGSDQSSLSSNVSITNNLIQDVQSNGIFLSFTENTTVKGNTLKHNHHVALFDLCNGLCPGGQIAMSDNTSLQIYSNEIIYLRRLHARRDLRSDVAAEGERENLLTLPSPPYPNQPMSKVEPVPRCGRCRTSVLTFVYGVSAIARIQFGVTSSVREVEWCWRSILRVVEETNRQGDSDSDGQTRKWVDKCIKSKGPIWDFISPSVAI